MSVKHKCIIIIVMCLFIFTWLRTMSRGVESKDMGGRENGMSNCKNKDLQVWTPIPMNNDHDSTKKIVQNLIII